MILKLMFAASVLIFGFSLTLAQAERFDIATFVPPPGWKRAGAGGGVTFTSSGGTGAACQIAVYPSRPSRGDATKDFDTAWTNIVTTGMGATVRPAMTSSQRPDGWTLASGAANITRSGSTFATMVTTASGFGKAMSIQMTILGSDTACTSAMSAFLESLKFDPGSASDRTASGVATTVAGDPASLYDITPPAGWTVRKMEGHLRLESSGGSCFILIFPPQTSSGDLQRDAAAVFDQMYQGWQPQKSGPQRYTQSKGILPGGQEFFAIEAGMKKPSADGARYDGFEDGVAIVVRSGSQIAVIAARHNSSLLAHSDCYGKYESWRRFFNSFAVKNAAAAPAADDPANRIIGRWSMTESGASGEYVFAANGNYALIGALGATSTSSDYNYDYLHIRTYAFPGDGSYRVEGRQLTLRPRGRGPEQVTIRFDMVNHGGSGWKDRIHLLKRDSRGESESTYEREGK